MGKAHASRFSPDVHILMLAPVPPHRLIAEHASCQAIHKGVPMSLWATKPIATLRAEADAVGAHSLKRSLGALNLTALGIGAIIGAGIFVLTGQAAALHAGPAVPISMILVGIACSFAGLCY